jgi:phosphoglycolate phosphatase-like HAD superfamily hydrolase
MEIKQKQCFHSVIISLWGLERVERAVRDIAEFVNLYSKYRGQNRFPCLLRVFDMLPAYPGVKESGVKMPATESLRAFCNSGLPMGNPTLEKLVAEKHNPELALVLKWSHDVNKKVAETVKNLAPFRWVRESLDEIGKHSDAVCVSQTPTEALVREWEENNMLDDVVVIAGQELGTKTEHLLMATQGRYVKDRVMMIGDAPGDLKAAREVGAHFFPINPGHEEASWELFYKEAYQRFLNGTFGGDYEKALVEKFNALLPETPAWERRG